MGSGVKRILDQLLTIDAGRSTTSRLRCDSRRCREYSNPSMRAPMRRAATSQLNLSDEVVDAGIAGGSTRIPRQADAQRVPRGGGGFQRGCFRFL